MMDIQDGEGAGGWELDLGSGWMAMGAGELGSGQGIMDV